MPTPEGPLSLPFLGLAELLATSARFQEITDAADETEALDFIHYPTLEIIEDTFEVPLAIITTELDLEMQLWKRGSPSGKLSSGQLLLELLFPADATQANDNDRFLKYINDVGVILRQMLDKANTIKPNPSDGYYWNLIQIDQLIAPAKCDPKLLHATLPDSEDPVDVYASGWFVRWV